MGRVAWTSLALCWALPAFAAAAVDTLRVDLNPLIDSAAKSPQQFAVNIPHAVSSAAQGTWSRHGSTSTWVYSVRIPTAVSMSFHASSAVLPPSAALTVSSAGAAVRYVARDVARSGLWGRPMPGDTLNFSLTVDSSEANRVRLQIDSLQAGYRSLGGGVPDHPHYRALAMAAAASTGCTVNYSCQVTAANQGPAHASVALIIANLYQCSGTLLNDTGADGAPYVLTARHCEGGRLGGGYPDAAATVTVYWDAVSPCGTALGSIYDNGTITQTGATTAFEQQDIWLIRLDSPPAANDAFYAGWDATGAPFDGGYTIHNALGSDQQYVAWNGTDVLEQVPGTTLSAPYDSTFWGVVNSLGNLGAGASGSALFSPNDLVVGSASLAELPGGTNSLGVCPVSPPAAPAPNSATALFTALSGVWTSTADSTSSTASKTLKSLLDPGATGQLTTTGLASQPITVTASQSFANSGDPVTLTWNVQGAQSCTASGGVPGDGWAGVEPASGSIQVTNEAGGTVNYSLTCVIGNQIGDGEAAVAWNYVAPTTNLSGGSPIPMTLGATSLVNWSANVGPCVASGGAAGDGWAGPRPASGSFTLTVTQTGITQYTLTCGPAPRIATSSFLVDGVSPAITLVANVTQIRSGSNFQLSWFGNGTGGACSASGGSATDGWSANNGQVLSNGSALVNETVAGTYTYTLTCTGGGQSASSSVTVIVTGDPPAISLSAVAPQQTVYQAGQSVNPTLDILWTSNVSGCFISYTSNSGLAQGVNLAGGNPSGAFSDIEFSPGVVTYTLQCQAQMATVTATIDWVTTATPNTLSVSDSSWAAGEAYPVSWNSGAGPCVGSGGVPGDGWAGPKALTGTQSVTESRQGTYVFTLVCGAGVSAATSSVAVTVPPPFIQIYSMPGSSAVTGLPITTVYWNSAVGSCSYLDGSAANSAPVPVPPSGSATPAPTASGTYLFSLSCGSGTSALYAATLAPVTVNAPTTLTASIASAPVDAPVTLTWNSADAPICYAYGGDDTAPWRGTLPGGGSGSLVVTSRYAATLTYAINCNNEVAQAVVTYVAVPGTSAAVATPAVTLSASASTQTAGQGISLVWNSTHADACTASDGNSGDGWSGNLALAGSMSVTEKSAGTATYTIICTGAPPAATASVTVIIVSAPTGTAASGSGGGGGALDPGFLLGLALLVGLRAMAESRAVDAQAQRRRNRRAGHLHRG